MAGINLMGSLKVKLIFKEYFSKTQSINFLKF